MQKDMKGRCYTDWI